MDDWDKPFDKPVIMWCHIPPWKALIPVYCWTLDQIGQVSETAQIERVEWEPQGY
jgi:hypothetical protein